MNPSPAPRCRVFSPARVAVLLTITSPLLFQSAKAADGTWNADASGSWTSGVTTNWASTVAEGADSTAYFTYDITGTRTITLTGLLTIGNLTFEDLTNASNDWVLAGSTLTLDRTSGTPTITVNGSSSRVATINSILAGNDGLTKEGVGILALGGANTYTGTTTVNAGTLRASVSGAVNGDVVVNNSAVLNFDGTTGVSFAYAGNVSGTGRITKTNGSSILTLSGNNTHTGGTTLTDGRIILGTGTNNGLGTGTFTLTGGSVQAIDNTTRTITNVLSMGSNNLNFGAVQGAATGVGDLTFSNTTAISVGGGKTWTVTNGTTATFANSWSGNSGWMTTKAGTGTLVFNGNYGTNTNTIGLTVGAGTMILNGSNNQYAGTTIVNGGTLYLNGSKVGAGAVTVNSTGTLAGSASIAGATTAASGSFLSPGSAAGAAGTLAFTTSLDISGLASGTGGLLFNLGAVGASDKITAASLSFGSGLLNFDDFSFTTLSGFGEGTYTLLSSSTSITGSSLGSNLTGTVGGLNGVISISGNDIVLTVSSVPEPSAYALLGGVLSLGVAAIRRRKRL